MLENNYQSTLPSLASTLTDSGSIDWTLIQDIDPISLRSSNGIETMKLIAQQFLKATTVPLENPSLILKLLQVLQVIVGYLCSSQDNFTEILKQKDLENQKLKEYIENESQNIIVGAQCPICSKVFKSLFFLDKHFIKSHQNMANLWQSLRMPYVVSQAPFYTNLFTEQPITPTTTTTTTTTNTDSDQIGVLQKTLKEIKKELKHKHHSAEKLFQKKVENRISSVENEIKRLTHTLSEPFIQYQTQMQQQQQQQQQQPLIIPQSSIPQVIYQAIPVQRQVEIEPNNIQSVNNKAEEKPERKKNDSHHHSHHKHRSSSHKIPPQPNLVEQATSPFGRPPAQNDFLDSNDSYNKNSDSLENNQDPLADNAIQNKIENQNFNSNLTKEKAVQNEIEKTNLTESKTKKKIKKKTKPTIEPNLVKTYPNQNVNPNQELKQNQEKNTTMQNQSVKHNHIHNNTNQKSTNSMNTNPKNNNNNNIDFTNSQKSNSHNNTDFTNNQKDNNHNNTDFTNSQKNNNHNNTDFTNSQKNNNHNDKKDINANQKNANLKNNNHNDANFQKSKKNNHNDTNYNNTNYISTSQNNTNHNNKNNLNSAHHTNISQNNTNYNNTNQNNNNAKPQVKSQKKNKKSKSKPSSKMQTSQEKETKDKNEINKAKETNSNQPFGIIWQPPPSHDHKIIFPESDDSENDKNHEDEIVIGIVNRNDYPSNTISTITNNISQNNNNIDNSNLNQQNAPYVYTESEQEVLIPKKNPHVSPPKARSPQKINNYEEDDGELADIPKPFIQPTYTKCVKSVPNEQHNCRLSPSSMASIPSVSSEFGSPYIKRNKSLLQEVSSEYDSKPPLAFKNNKK